MTVRRWVVVALVAVAGTLLAVRVAAGLYTGYEWYRGLGALSVWRARTSALLVLRLLGGAVATGFAFANCYAVRRSVVSLVLPRRVGNLDIGEEVSSRALTVAALLLALAIARTIATSPLPSY